MKKIPLDDGEELLVSDGCLSQIEAAKSRGRTVQFLACDVEATAAVCSNCKGLETLVFELSGKGDGERKRKREFINSGCPACHPGHEAERVAFLLSESGLRPVEYGWTLAYGEGIEGKRQGIEAMAALVEEAPRPTGWVTLYGGYGVGKSGLLKATVAQFCHAGVAAAYRRAGDILSEAKATFSDDGEAQDRSELAVKVRYGRYSFLAVDEIDRITMSEWSKSFIFSLLDERYNRRESQATAIATNKMPGQMGEAFLYLEDRMKDGQRLMMGGRSLRGGWDGGDR